MALRETPFQPRKLTGVDNAGFPAVQRFVAAITSPPCLKCRMKLEIGMSGRLLNFWPSPGER